MNVLNEIEEKLKASLDIEKLKLYALNSVGRIMNQKDNEVVDAVYETLGKDYIEYQFLGIAIYCFDIGLREPYLRVQIGVSNKRTEIPVAQYDLEYGTCGEVQDDYFYLV